LTETSSDTLLENKFFADEPNNANIITAPATMKIIANFHMDIF
jgi:hypothetical protein